METFEIKSRWSDTVLFTATAATLAEAVKLAIQARANLSGANLSGADLFRANLSGANLYGANLSGADLSRADLSRADLSGANLSGANLSGANLSRANLSGANLSGADLYGANLYGANLFRADLFRANLSGANLSGADLSGANLSDAKNAALVIAQTRILPEGQLIGWKSCKFGVIVKLSIPAESRRSHAFGRKCRADFADVLETFNGEVGISQHDGKTAYRTGERVTCHKWSEDWQEECAGGIHFFITREEAEAY